MEPLLIEFLGSETDRVVVDFCVSIVTDHFEDENGSLEELNDSLSAFGLFLTEDKLSALKNALPSTKNAPAPEPPKPSRSNPATTECEGAPVAATTSKQSPDQEQEQEPAPDQPAASPVPFDLDLAFPHLPKPVILSILNDNPGNIEATIDTLLTLTDDQVTDITNKLTSNNNPVNNSSISNNSINNNSINITTQSI
jgi:hypothetical protein